MIKTLMRCVREYKKATLLTPFFVSLEVIVECFLPLEISELINRIQEGCGIGTIVKYGLVLVLLAFASLALGVWPEITVRRLAVDLPRISDTTCTIRSRIFLSITLTGFQAQVLLPV